MRQFDVKLRKGWTRVEGDEILDQIAPVGALAWGAKPDKGGTNFNIYVYRSQNDILRECALCASRVDGRQPLVGPFGEFRSVCTNASFCRGQFWGLYMFIEIEDYIVAISSYGSQKQLMDNMDWIEKHYSLGDEIPDNNGNPMTGGIPLVPPAMLFQMVDFTQRDYEMTRKIIEILPDHFKFIVDASMTPAVDAEELVARVNEDYRRHNGYIEIDYSNLREDAIAILEGKEDIYIGTAKAITNPWGVTTIETFIYGLTEEPLCEELLADEDLYEQISDLVEGYE